MNSYGTLTAPDTLRLERVLPGPIERVWSFLTESDKRRQWLAAGDMATQKGGPVELVFRNSELTEDDDPPPAKYASESGEVRTSGEITEFAPPNRLSFIWFQNTEVTFELTQEQDSVRLVLTHRRVGNPDTLLSVSGGWHAHLGILEDLLNNRNPAPFWRAITRLEEEYKQRFAVQV